MTSLVEIKFAKHSCTIEVVYYFLNGTRHEVSFSDFFVSFPHVHAQSYSTRFFRLGHEYHRGYPGDGSFSRFNNILFQEEFNTSFKILSLKKQDASVRLMNRSYILINICNLTSTFFILPKPLNFGIHFFRQTELLQFLLFQGLQQFFFNPRREVLLSATRNSELTERHLDSTKSLNFPTTRRSLNEFKACT